MRIVLGAVVAAVIAACGGSSGGRPPAQIPSDETSLGVGDVFDVRVYGEEELTGSYRVTESGTIDYPFVGRVRVAGLEPNEVADLLQQQLRDGGYMRSPQVSIFVREYNSKRVTVMGAVARPGAFPMTSGLTVVQAISLAGGFTSLASRNGTVVTRQASGNLERFNVRAEDITEGTENDFPLRAGDIIYVPERVF